MSHHKSFDRDNTSPRYVQVQTRLTHTQAMAFNAMMRKTGCTRAETARQLIAKGLEKLQGVTL